MSPGQDLIEGAIAALVRGKPGEEPFVLAPGAREKIAGLLAQVPDDAITFAIAELCALAGWLAAERQSPGAKAALLDVAAGALHRLRDGAAAEALQQMDRAAGGALDRVTGAERVTLRPPAAPAPGTARGGVLSRIDLDKALPRAKS